MTQRRSRRALFGAGAAAVVLAAAVIVAVLASPDTTVDGIASTVPAARQRNVEKPPAGLVSIDDPREDTNDPSIDITAVSAHVTPTALRIAVTFAGGHEAGTAVFVSIDADADVNTGVVGGVDFPTCETYRSSMGTDYVAVYSQGQGSIQAATGRSCGSLFRAATPIAAHQSGRVIHFDIPLRALPRIGAKLRLVVRSLNTADRQEDFAPGPNTPVVELAGP